MESCRACAAPVDDSARACPTCGADTPVRLDFRIRETLAAVALGALALIATGVFLHSGACTALLFAAFFGVLAAGATIAAVEGE